MNEESIGRIVEMRTLQSAYQGVGKVIGYQKSPTFMILTPAGKIVSWVAELCSEAVLSEEAVKEIFAHVQRSEGR